MADDEECDFINVPAETPLSPEEAIVRRHRREKKELQGKIQQLKKNVPAKDKKKKKELADEIAKLEAELELRHKAELDTFIPKRLDLTAASIPATLDEVQSEVGDDDGRSECPGTPKMSKARRRREKKEQEEKERQKRIDQETDDLTENSKRTLEDKLLEELLKTMKLSEVDIPSDGHCLYKAVSDQLTRIGDPSWDVDKLRKQVASHLRSNQDQFIHFLDDDYSTPEGYEKYCTELESTPAWGGQIEVQVLSQVLSRPISVIQADGPPLQFGEDGKNKPGITLTFHRHRYQLGAHYNSTVPQED